MLSALIFVVCWAAWAVAAQTQNSLQNGLTSQGNNNNHRAVADSTIIVGGDSRTLQAPPTSSPFPALFKSFYPCPVIEKSNGTAVVCCNNRCIDGFTAQDPISQCYRVGDSCFDGPGNPKCTRSQVGYVSQGSLTDSGDGVCFGVNRCQWQRFIYSSHCCDCPAGYIDSTHGLSCVKKRSYSNRCVGCPDGYDVTGGYDATGDYYFGWWCTPTKKTQPTLQPTKQPTKLLPCLKPPNAKPTDTGNCRTCSEVGELTKFAEDSGGGTDVLYHPSSASGVTLGYGYDLRERTADSVVRDLEAAGMDNLTAQSISKGVRLSGANATAFVDQNKNIRIPLAVREALFKNEFASKALEAKRYATRTKYTGNDATAVGRAVVEGLKNRLTYVLTSKQWQGLHPAMVDLLTDMKYQGGYYAFDRIAKVNAALKANDGNQVAQFQAVADLFEKQNKKNSKTGKIVSYMDDYAINIGEGGYNKKGESFYGQSAKDLVCVRRRNCIRLAYLKQIIAALMLKQEIQKC